MNREFLPQGAEITPDGVRYRVWAPACRRIEVEIQTPDGRQKRFVALEPREDGYFQGSDPEGRAGDLYQYRLDERRSRPDPSSRWQPRGVHGPSMVIDPAVYEWRDQGFRRRSVRDLVIYEIHVGAFTEEGTFRSAIPRLPHLRALGVTALEIMPIAEFPGERNWGYDGVSLFAPSRAYGHPDDLRALVDAAHAEGLTVILDVVYNHFGPEGNYLGEYIGAYFDESRKTPWGGAIRYDSPDFRPLRALIVANVEYWMREFHIDGFRLDATHAVLDASPRHLFAEVNAAIHTHGGFSIAEDSRNDSWVLCSEEQGGAGFDGVWADDFHHSLRVGQTHENESYLGDFNGSAKELVDALRHGWIYRGQYSPRKGANRGTECRHLAPEKFIHCISNHDQIGNRALGDRFSDVV
ncbi:MAG TPA: alpha-amylase family glycosyl hydrolase, partial [Chthoniobacteraceae bacterium]